MGIKPCILNVNRENKELQPHGTPEFPCAGYSTVYIDNGKVIPWHWHEEIEIVYLESGSLSLQIPGKTFHLKQGQSFAINSNILHYGTAEPLCSLHSLVFHPLLVTGTGESAFASRYLMPLTHCPAFDGCLLESIAGEGDRCADDFIRAFEAFSQEYPGYEFTVRENLSHICLALYRHYEHEIDLGHTCMNPDNIRIRKMLDHIHNHYHENLDLAQIAKAADIGERECLRCFKRVIQTSPMQYLLKYRTTQGAAMLLKEPSSSVSEIAGMCGFNSPSNFSQMFSRYFNCSPREYRKGNSR